MIYNTSVIYTYLKKNKQGDNKKKKEKKKHFSFVSGWSLQKSDYEQP